MMKLLIDGELVDGDQTLEVVNPATGQVAMLCPRASVRQLDDAVAAARAAFPAWSAKTVAERTAALAAVADIIEANAEEIGRLIVTEQGKPLADAMMEVHFAAYSFRNAGSLQVRDRERIEDPSRHVEVRRRPLGVVGCILPWNVPLAMVGAKLPFAFITGNTVILKPAQTTPLSAVRLGELIKDALPPGVINIIVDDGDLGQRITEHPGIDKISFTGSTATGKRVMSSASGTLKRITLELGGNDAGIVLDDVEVDDAAPAIFASAFANNGQICMALKRLYVHDTVYEAMCEKLSALVGSAVLGDGMDPDTQFGPIQNRAQYDRVKDLLESARSDGTVITGDGDLPEAGYFIRPTIVRDISDGSRLVDEEQFGPVLPVIRYSDVEDAIARANASSYALGGSIWSSDVARASALAERLDSGTVWINKHSDLSLDIPFAGAKQSGLGVEFGAEGLNEFTQIQVINRQA